MQISKPPLINLLNEYLSQGVSKAGEVKQMKIANGNNKEERRS